MFFLLDWENRSLVGERARKQRQPEEKSDTELKDEIPLGYEITQRSNVFSRCGSETRAPKTACLDGHYLVRR